MSAKKNRKEEERIMEKREKSVSKEITPSIAFTQWEKVAPKIGANLIKFHQAIKRAEEKRKSGEINASENSENKILEKTGDLE